MCRAKKEGFKIWIISSVESLGGYPELAKKMFDRAREIVIDYSKTIGTRLQAYSDGKAKFGEVETLAEEDFKYLEDEKTGKMMNLTKFLNKELGCGEYNQKRAIVVHDKMPKLRQLCTLRPLCNKCSACTIFDYNNCEQSCTTLPKKFTCPLQLSQKMASTHTSDNEIPPCRKYYKRCKDYEVDYEIKKTDCKNCSIEILCQRKAQCKEVSKKNSCKSSCHINDNLVLCSKVEKRIKKWIRDFSSIEGDKFYNILFDGIDTLYNQRVLDKIIKSADNNRSNKYDHSNHKYNHVPLIAKNKSQKITTEKMFTSVGTIKIKTFHIRPKITDADDKCHDMNYSFYNILDKRHDADNLCKEDIDRTVGNIYKQALLKSHTAKKDKAINFTPICVFLGGAPGTGKSYFVKKFIAWLKDTAEKHNNEIDKKLKNYKKELLAKKNKTSNELEIIRCEQKIRELKLKKINNGDYDSIYTSLSGIPEDNLYDAIQQHISNVYADTAKHNNDIAVAFLDEIDTKCQHYAFRLLMDAMTGDRTNEKGNHVRHRDTIPKTVIWFFAGSGGITRNDFIENFDDAPKIKDFFDRIHFDIRLPFSDNPGQAILVMLNKLIQPDNNKTVYVSEEVLKLFGTVKWKSTRLISTIMDIINVKIKDAKETTDNRKWTNHNNIILVTLNLFDHIKIDPEFRAVFRNLAHELYSGDLPYNPVTREWYKKISEVHKGVKPFNDTQFIKVEFPK